MERGNLRGSVDNADARLWRRDFSAGTSGVRLIVIPGELASGGAISRRRSLGIFLWARAAAERSFITDALSMTC